MKKIFTFLILLTCIVSCKNVSDTDINLLNGYWEIQKVVQPDGKEIDFGINTIYDYYQVNNNNGIYKKAQPQLDGTFIVDDYQEEIEILNKKGKFFINFKSEFNSREVQIITISDNNLEIKNPDDKTYYYKRAESINLTK